MFPSEYLLPSMETSFLLYWWPICSLPRPELLEDAYSMCLTHLRNIQLPVCVQQAFHIYVLLQPSQGKYTACIVNNILLEPGSIWTCRNLHFLQCLQDLRNMELQKYNTKYSILLYHSPHSHTYNVPYDTLYTACHISEHTIYITHLCNSHCVTCHLEHHTP